MSLAGASYVSRYLRRTVAGWVSSVVGLSADAVGSIPRVVWSEQNLPRPALPYVSLRQLTSSSAFEQSRLVTIPTLSEVTVTTTTVGEAARVILAYGAPGYAVQVGDDLAAVRAGLIAAINARPDPVAITLDADPAKFQIAGLGPGLAWPLSAVEGCTVDTLTLSDVEITETSRTTVVRVECFGYDTPDARALDVLDALVGNLGRAATAAYFADRGCAVVGARPSVTDISAVSGAERETRAYFDLRVSQWTRYTTTDAPALADSSPGYLVELQRPQV